MFINFMINFTSKNQNDKLITSQDLLGCRYLIYFYPKDNTPGCTIQARDLSKNIEKFLQLGVKVIGVSRDSVKKHCGFIEKQGINFDLLADEDGSVCNTFGVLKEKSMFGKKYLGIERSSFLINTKGEIEKEWRKVSPLGHSKLIIEYLENIK